MNLKNYVYLMRPRQWFKSLYIILGALPAIFLMPTEPLLIAWLLALGIINMILMQGVVYTINDISDIKEDRPHPTKKYRPIASGLISIKQGAIFATFLLILALLLAYFIDFKIVLIDLTLLAIALLYNIKPFRFKNRPWFDIFSAAANSPLRVMVGWYLFEPYNEARLSFLYNITQTRLVSASIQSIFFNIPPSIIDLSVRFSTITLSFGSMMLLTYFLACFLLSLKRLAEKLTFKHPEKFRSSLRFYSVPKLKAISLISLAICVFSFGLFAISLKLTLIFLTPLLIYGICWYYRLTFTKSSLVSQPEKIFTKMPKFILLAIVSLVLALILLLI